MKHNTERVLSIIAVGISLLCGAYIGHTNTLDHIQAQHNTPCTTTVTRSCTSWKTYDGTPLTVWHDAQGHTWYTATQAMHTTTTQATHTWHDGLPACTDEDGSGQTSCYWDAQARGNHQGHSYTITNGTTHYIN